MESLNSSMKAVLITPLVSSLELGCRRCRSKNILIKWLSLLFLSTSCLHKYDIYLEIQQCIQLVLNGGQSLNQLLCVHGAHHTISPGKKQEHMRTNRHATHKQHSSATASILLTRFPCRPLRVLKTLKKYVGFSPLLRNSGTMTVGSLAPPTPAVWWPRLRWAACCAPTSRPLNAKAS